jgi:aspartate/methionine/tyrosine aminotransferase
VIAVAEWKFSTRLPPHADVNPLTRALAALQAAYVPIADLTVSNPTAVGIAYPDDLFEMLSARDVRRYSPHPRGLAAARESVAADYARRGSRVDPADVLLSASTSEAYSWLFKLLCNPGEGVLVPHPSYPLFEHLTRLEAVQPTPYHLSYHGRWEVDFDSVIAAPANVRALLVVSPNNPTGSYLTRGEAQRLAEISRLRGWAIVADEVFADYPLDLGDPPTDTVMDLDVLSFTLGGASKSLGLPQVKLAWTVVGGRHGERARALDALEMIADTFLSVSTPVQGAAPSLFARAEAVRHQIHRRVTANLARARQLSCEYPSCTLLPVEGGWSAVVRVPAFRSEEALALELLERERVLVYPGYFFDFPREAYIVVSLLPAEDQFADAFARALKLASTPRSPSSEHKR